MAELGEHKDGDVGEISGGGQEQVHHRRKVVDFGRIVEIGNVHGQGFAFELVSLRRRRIVKIVRDLTSRSLVGSNE